MRAEDFNLDDTVAAVVTAPGAAGVSIVRISGSEALAVADRIFCCAGDPPSSRPGGTVVYGRVMAGDAAIDEVLLLIMRAPKSFTAEDVVEIQGHGGSQCSRRILRAVYAAGARPAEPGEFTRRAFLNGRIDLLQAEAVLDLIRAGSERAAAAAMEQLEGGLSTSFERVYDDLLTCAADLEAFLDFSEDDLPEGLLGTLQDRLHAADLMLGELIATWEEGHLLRDGALVVISGQPNVGKSTLLNALLGTRRAIVSEQAGTTRDSIEETLMLHGMPLRLVDTAGLRDTGCSIEQEGIKIARNHLVKADLHLHILDASVPMTPESRALLQDLDPRRTVVVLNKMDLGRKAVDEVKAPWFAVETTLVQGEGLEALRHEMSIRLGHDHFLAAPPHAVISERHRDLLLVAREELSRARACLREHGEEGPALAAPYLRDSLEQLGSATGKCYSEDLLDQIFSRFCVGK